MRISPPLTISPAEIDTACQVIIDSIKEVAG
jgi:4-aminobutyrate aminotransferase-like enzyme